MAGLVKYIYGTEAQILALDNTHDLWCERAFYYPSDKSYFYQLVNGGMKKYGDGEDAVASSGVGVFLNGKVIGGVKTLIESIDSLLIPVNYDYNTFQLYVEGTIQCNGQINMI
jgi:hypothetical protein